jgi:hypothetical protein
MVLPFEKFTWSRFNRPSQCSQRAIPKAWYQFPPFTTSLWHSESHWQGRFSGCAVECSAMYCAMGLSGQTIPPLGTLPPPRVRGAGRVFVYGSNRPEIGAAGLKGSVATIQRQKNCAGLDRMSRTCCSPDLASLAREKLFAKNDRIRIDGGRHGGTEQSGWP